MQNILWAVVFLFSFSLAAAGTCTDSSKRPTLTPGQTYTPNSGCPYGGFYDTATTRCSCWSYCGYICGNTCADKRPTNLTSGSYYLPNTDCPNGNTYDINSTPKYRCHCWSRCGYICDPQSSSGTFPRNEDE